MTKKSIGFLVAIILCGTGVYLIEQRKIRRLQAENQNLVVQKTASLASQAPVVDLNQGERNELERLRRDMAGLLRLRNEVTQLRRESEARKQQLLGTGGGLARALPSSNFIPKEQVVNVGLATPEAALQSYMAAMASGSFEQVLATLPPAVTNDPASRASFEKAIKDELLGFRGLQMTAKKVLSDDRVDIQVLVFEEGRAPELGIQHLVKIGSEWRMGGSTSAGGWNQDGKVQLLTPAQ